MERLNFRNELNLQATSAYWKWAAAYENKLVLEEGVKLAKIRFDGIKRSYELGEQAAIDTVEALSQLLNRQYRLQLAENTFFENTQVLNTYLWNDSGEPMLLDSAMIPQALSRFGKFERRKTLKDPRIASCSQAEIQRPNRDFG